MKTVRFREPQRKRTFEYVRSGSAKMCCLQQRIIFKSNDYNLSYAMPPFIAGAAARRDCTISANELLRAPTAYWLALPFKFGLPSAVRGPRVAVACPEAVMAPSASAAVMMQPFKDCNKPSSRQRFAHTTKVLTIWIEFFRCLGDVTTSAALSVGMPGTSLKKRIIIFFSKLPQGNNQCFLRMVVRVFLASNN